jgi:hypothetical protein
MILVRKTTFLGRIPTMLARAAIIQARKIAIVVLKPVNLIRTTAFLIWKLRISV